MKIIYYYNQSTFVRQEQLSHNVYGISERGDISSWKSYTNYVIGHTHPCYQSLIVCIVINYCWKPPNFWQMFVLFVPISKRLFVLLILIWVGSFVWFGASSCLIYVNSCRLVFIRTRSCFLAIFPVCSSIFLYVRVASSWHKKSWHEMSWHKTPWQERKTVI